MKGKGLAKLAMILSFVALIMSGVVSLTGSAIWIAGTQWILIAIVLAVYGLYLDGMKGGE
jgi:hypothetical protein